jgi:hypothetical protein
MTPGKLTQEKKWQAPTKNPAAKKPRSTPVKKQPAPRERQPEAV